MNNRREQAIGAALFTLLVLIGWAPYFLATVDLGIFESRSILLGGFFAIIAAGLTFDAAEKLFGFGKGVYAAAILTSFPAAAIVFSSPPFLAETSLMFVSSAALWFAARSTKENPREGLVFIALLSAIVLAVFGFWPPAFIPLLALFVLRSKTQTSMQSVFIAGCVGLAGLMIRPFLSLTLPDIMGNQPDVDVSTAEAVVLNAPWFAFMLVALFLKSTWPRVAVIGVALLTLIHAQFGGEWIGILRAASPLLALAITQSVLRWFEAEPEGDLRAIRWSSLLLVLVFFGIAIARIAHYESLVINRNHAVLGLLVAGFLIAATLRDSRRWIFALHVIAGLLIGAIWWYYSADDYQAATAISFDIAPWLVACIFFYRGAIELLYGRRMPRKLREPGPRNLFDNIVFRKFSNVSRKQWEGEVVAVVPKDPAHVRFAIFGDITGSEFPLSSRKSGYFVFRTIVDAITNRQPDFVISTGDMATAATHLSYRRLRKLLRRLNFPLLVTPGNHDIVYQSTIVSQYFHALFGSDNGEIEIGTTRLILINNAWGSLTDEQWEWVEKTFAKNSSAKTTLVFCHKPVFDPRENVFYGMEWRPHAERLHALFVKHSVTAVFSGHIHTLLHSDLDGVQYIISGGGGSKLKTAQDVHHYLWCEATAAGVHLTAHGVDRNDVLLDLNLKARS